LRLDTGERRVLIQGGATAHYLPTGHLVYSRAGNIMAVSFDSYRLEISGAPVPLIDDLRDGTLAADYAVSAAGSLVYIHQSPGARNRTPVLVDRKGTPRALPGLAPAYYQDPRFSPDGRQVAFTVTGPLIDIWLYDIARTTLTRLSAPGSSQYPAWSPDGARIVQEFVMIQPSEKEAPPKEIDIILNWAEDVKRKVAPAN
jgi:dipeptidyl aminopeptidase/acylaminoacyl peptidase